MLDLLINLTAGTAALLGFNLLNALGRRSSRALRRGDRRILLALLLAFAGTALAAWRLRVHGELVAAWGLLGCLWLLATVLALAAAAKARWN